MTGFGEQRATLERSAGRLVAAALVIWPWPAAAATEGQALPWAVAGVAGLVALGALAALWVLWRRLGARLSALSEAQAEYLGINAKGPFKPDYYRY